MSPVINLPMLVLAAIRVAEVDGRPMTDECGLWNPDAIERQLAHVYNDSVRRAYARADYWEERVRMMAWWAERCREMHAGGIVVSLRA
jgi:hypothetical protein